MQEKLRVSRKNVDIFPFGGAFSGRSWGDEIYRNEMTEITLRRPDDWHLHLRDGDMLKAVLPFTVRQFARAIVMPNLAPPVKTAAEAEAYRGRIGAALPEGADFTPLMTCYLADDTDSEDLIPWPPIGRVHGGQALSGECDHPFRRRRHRHHPY